jgi:hypothetical protein
VNTNTNLLRELSCGLTDSTCGCVNQDSLTYLDAPEKFEAELSSGERNRYRDGFFGQQVIEKDVT